MTYRKHSWSLINNKLYSKYLKLLLALFSSEWETCFIVLNLLIGVVSHGWYTTKGKGLLNFWYYIYLTVQSKPISKFYLRTHFVPNLFQKFSEWKQCLWKACLFSIIFKWIQIWLQYLLNILTCVGFMELTTCFLVLFCISLFECNIESCVENENCKEILRFWVTTRHMWDKQGMYMQIFDRKTLSRNTIRRPWFLFK